MKKMLVLGLMAGLAGLWLVSDAEACKKPPPKCPPKPCVIKHHGHHHGGANANAAAYAFSGGGGYYHPNHTTIIIQQKVMPPPPPTTKWKLAIEIHGLGKDYFYDGGGRTFKLREGNYEAFAKVVQNSLPHPREGMMTRDGDTKCNCRWFSEQGRLWFYHDPTCSKHK